MDENQRRIWNYFSCHICTSKIGKFPHLLVLCNKYLTIFIITIQRSMGHVWDWGSVIFCDFSIMYKFISILLQNQLISASQGFITLSNIINKRTSYKTDMTLVSAGFVMEQRCLLIFPPFCSCVLLGWVWRFPRSNVLITSARDRERTKEDEGWRGS